MSDVVYLSLVVVLAVVLLLVLIMKFKVQAFISLILVSIIVAVAAKMPLDKIMGSIQNGMGGTLGFIAVVVGLGSIFGKMLEYSGGAERLARTLVAKFGKERASWAMALTGFIVAIPVFFDVGFIILVPIVYSLSKETKKSLLHYGIPLLAGLAVAHSFIPPTPGPVAVAQLVGADLGKVILFGIIAGIPAALIAGPIFGKYIGKKIHAEVPEYMLADVDTSKVDDKDLPSFLQVVSLILIPLVLMVFNTFTNVFLPKGNDFRTFMGFIGHPFAALTIATLLSFWILGTKRGLTMKRINELATASLAPAGLIILVTGAGGVFKQVLIDSGVGKMLADNVENLHINPLLLAFLIAVLVRVAAGSATVSMMTAGGIMAPMLGTLSVSPALLVIAIASGATVLSYVNDSGFWLVNRYLGISEKDTLKSWTVMETLIGVVGIIVVLILGIFIKA